MKITKMSLLISGLAAVWLGLSGQVPAAVPDVMSCQGTLYTEGDSGLHAVGERRDSRQSRYSALQGSR